MTYIISFFLIHWLTLSLYLSINITQILLIAKARFCHEKIEDLTSDVTKELNKIVEKSPAGDGDIIAIKVSDYMLASFHGDTNGLASLPILRAVHQVANRKKLRLVFGLDANTYRDSDPKKQQCLGEFRDVFEKELKLNSCWGKGHVPNSTFNGRTFLQAQLNKSVRSNEMKKAMRNSKYTGSPWLDRNPKDFILFSANHFKFDSTKLDNTGKLMFKENDPIPTLEFPSDHSVVSTTLSVVDDE